ncbi:MAG: hypothetical protein V3V31_09385 [Methylococcales bacterium]
MTDLPIDQQQLTLDIDPIQERLLNYYRKTAKQKISASGFPSTLRFIDEIVTKFSSHPATLTDLQNLQAKIQEQQKRKIVSLLFEYQREVLQCSDKIGLLKTQLDDVGADQPPSREVDENCFKKFQELLGKEDIASAERILKSWRQLRPDDKTTDLQQRKLISEKLVALKSQLKELRALSESLRQSLRNNDDNQVTEIITARVSNLFPPNAKRFWDNNEKVLSDYFIGKAKNDLDREDFNHAREYCDRGLSIYAQSSTLKTDCKDLVENQKIQRISGLIKIFENYLKKGWLTTGVRYRDGVLGVLDEISKFDNNNSLLKSVEVHSAFKNALLDAVKKMQIEEARVLNERWAKFFTRKYTSDDAVGIRDSGKNQSATHALSIARDLIHEGFGDRAKELLQLGLELGPIASVKKQLEKELTSLNLVRH